MKTHQIAVIPGDNIGPEVIAAGRQILQRVADRGICGFEFETFPWGAGHYLRTGRAAPVNLLDVLRPFDAIYLGAHGDPSRVSDRVGSRELMHPIRQGFDLYVNVRPVKLDPGISSPLHAPGEIDLVVVRENTEGEYANVGGRVHAGTDDELAIQSTVITRRGAERVMRFAFELARQRNQKKYVHCVTKANALAHVMDLWDETFARVSTDYPDVRTGRSHVDAMSMFLISKPATFDVIVSTNLMGDILSDEAAAVVGGIGLAAGANLNPRRTTPSLFEPIHGSAPDIAGKGIANPIAAIRAAALMLDWLGETRTASAIESAIEQVLADGKLRTPDLGGTDGTHALTEEILVKFDERSK